MERTRYVKAGALALLAAGFGVVPRTAAGQAVDGATELRVLISPGFAAAYDVLVAEFERAAGVTVVSARGGSTGEGPGAIPGRVARGEAADVVIVAAEGMDEMIVRGVVVPATRVDLAMTGVGMAVTAGHPRPDISSVEALRRALLEAETVAYSTGPSGTHLSSVVLPMLGIADQVTAKAVITNAVPSALLRGEARVGFQQVSELVPIAGVDYVGPLPADVQQMTTYAAAVVTHSAQPEVAAALIAFLAAPSATRVVERMGLERLK